MNSLKYLMIAIITLSSVAGIAQPKNQKTETVKIYGNCGMCKTTIEKAGNMKNQSTVDWNKDTKMATISYDSLKTSKDEILKRVALAGYDSETFLAPDDTYASLPGCCHYERAEKTMAKMDATKMEIATNDHSMHANNMTAMQETNPLSPVFNNYFAVKDALVKTDGAAASTNASNLLAAINEVKMDKLSMESHMAWMKVLKNLKEDAKQIADTKDAAKQRDNFMTLSKSMYEVMKVSKQDSPTYYQFCPMANDGKGANWLSKEDKIRNPYYGSQMMSCGKTIETIKD